MRTCIISDLHLGNGGPYDAFAGADELPAFLDSFGREPVHVFVNGDGVDFLMNEDPLEMNRARAAEQARAIAADPASAGVFRAFGRVLSRGGNVTVRLGNHDLELSLPEVAEVLRGAMNQPFDVANRLDFQLGFAPAILDVGGARILVTHGEHTDKWNKVEYEQLQAPETYKYTAGSTLVKQILNPLTRGLGLRFMNFLKPDFSGGTLTGLAVNPAMVKELFKTATIDIVSQLVRRIGMAAAFAPSEDDGPDVGESLETANLDDEEKLALEALLSDAPASFSTDEETPSKLSIKLARAGLKLYAGLQRLQAGSEAADKFLDLEPSADEWKDAQRLAQKEHAGAVIYGHTHAARWKQTKDVVFANTGTWIWLMQLPSMDADLDVWTDFLTELRQNPRLDPARQNRAKTLSRFTAVLLEPHPQSGAVMSLGEWKGGKLDTLGQTHVPATRA